jgi:hypothetical protein
LSGQNPKAPGFAGGYLLRGSFLVSAYAVVDGERRLVGAEAVLSRWNVAGCANCQTHVEAKAFLNLHAFTASAVDGALFEVDSHPRWDPERPQRSDRRSDEALQRRTPLATDQKDTSMSQSFPAVGHRYLVDFTAFRVELSFASETSMTYTGVKPDGSHSGSETVAITVRPVRDGLFLVTWQEADKTTVVHLEDYKRHEITTHITRPDLDFSIYHGTMRLIP